MEQQHFTRMDESNREQWMFIGQETRRVQSDVPNHILGLLRSLDAPEDAGFGWDPDEGSG